MTTSSQSIWSSIGENVNNILPDNEKTANLKHIANVIADGLISYGHSVQKSSRELYNSSDSNLAEWQKLFLFFDKVNTAINWRIGSWVNPSWDRPLPERFVLDKAFTDEFRGHPDLYVWRVNVTDLATAIPAGAMTVTRHMSKRISAALNDLSVSVALGIGAERLSGVSRAEDEIPDGESPSVLFYLSDYKLARAGYRYVPDTYPFEFIR